MDFYRSEKSNQEKEKINEQIRELKELVQKNSLMIEEIKKEKEQALSSYHDVTTSPDNDNQNLLAKYEELVSKLTSLEETMAQDKQETLSEYQKFIKSGSQLDYKETFVQFKDPLPLVEERINKKLMLLNKTQEEAQKQLNTLTEALDMLGNGMEELHTLMKIQSKVVPNSHQEKIGYEKLLQDFVNNLQEFKLEIQKLLDRIVTEKFSAISSLLAIVTSKTDEINKILNDSEVSPISPTKPVEETERSEPNDNPENQW